MTGSYDSSGGGSMKLIGRVDSMNPALQNIIGPVKFIEVEEFFEPMPAGNSNPWGETWVQLPYQDGPNVRLSTHAVPITPPDRFASTGEGETKVIVASMTVGNKSGFVIGDVEGVEACI